MFWIFGLFAYLVLGQNSVYTSSNGNTVVTIGTNGNYETFVNGSLISNSGVKRSSGNMVVNFESTNGTTRTFVNGKLVNSSRNNNTLANKSAATWFGDIWKLPLFMWACLQI
jgi:hypothetical protein